MTKAQKAFFKQIELEEEDVKRDFLTSYAYGLLDQEENDPLQRALDMLNDEWELDPEATLAEQFGLIGMPSAFLLNREGALISKHVGFRKAKLNKYEASIVDALK